MLDKRQLEAFFSVGYVVRPDVFAPEEVREMLRAFERLESVARRLGRTRMHDGSLFVLTDSHRGDGSPDLSIQRIVWCGAAEPRLAEYGKDPRLVSMAAAVLGSRRMHQLINQAHFKRPGDGVEFPWHQDSTHRRYGGHEWVDANGRGSYVQTVVAVDDMTEDNGPLQFVPGSCKLGHIGPVGEGGRLPDELIDPARVVTVAARAGSVVLFGPYTFHRSGANRSSRPRRSFINGFAYPGANSRVYPGRGAGRLVIAS
jgi:ectoine hydroxylase-related dioxygenase (phytanoyl-CoA dioxygenase family)